MSGDWGNDISGVPDGAEAVVMVLAVLEAVGIGREPDADIVVADVVVADAVAVDEEEEEEDRRGEEGGSVWWCVKDKRGGD